MLPSNLIFYQFDNELQLLVKYLELERLRFGGEFAYEIKGDSKVEDIKIPTMIIQPYLENALKHGLLHKKGDDKKMPFLRKAPNPVEEAEPMLGSSPLRKVKSKDNNMQRNSSLLAYSIKSDK